MLGKRYKYDGKPIIKLNSLQAKIKSQIEEKIRDGHYQTEKVACAVCGGESFEPFSEKDRFGLQVAVVICRDCGLIQTNPRLTKESFNEFYKTEHTKLIFGQEKPTKELFLDQYFHAQKIYRYLEKAFPKSPKEMLVLEIGCGAGGILSYFRDQGCQVAGVDLDEECISFGREKYNLNLQVGTLAEGGFKRQPDIVIMSHILEHLLNPNEELLIIRALINPDGLVYIEVPGARNMTFIHNDMNFLRFLQIAHTYHFSLTTLENILNKNGFEMLKGNERIMSIFKPGKKGKTYKNDYETALVYLRRLEILRKCLPITPFRVKYTIESAYCWLLKKTKLYAMARKIYRKLINRTEPINYKH